MYPSAIVHPSLRDGDNALVVELFEARESVDVDRVSAQTACTQVVGLDIQALLHRHGHERLMEEVGHAASGSREVRREAEERNGDLAALQGRARGEEIARGETRDIEDVVELSSANAHV